VHLLRLQRVVGKLMAQGSEGTADHQAKLEGGLQGSRRAVPPVMVGVGALLMGGFMTGCDFHLLGGVTAACWYGGVAEGRTREGSDRKSN
jgi:hypothetical protein